MFFLFSIIYFFYRLSIIQLQLTKITITRFFFFFSFSEFYFYEEFFLSKNFRRGFELWTKNTGSVALATSREQTRTSNKRMEYFFIDEIVSNLWIFQHLYRHRYIFFCIYIYNNSIILYYNIIRLLYLFMYQRYSNGWSMIYLYHSFQHWRSCSTRITIELWYFLSWMGNKI